MDVDADVVQAPAVAPAAAARRGPDAGRALGLAGLLVPAALGALLAASPLASGYYSSSVWAPAGLVVAVLLAAALVAGVARPSRLAVVAVAALAALAAWSLLSGAWADSAGNATVEGDRLVAYALLLALLVVALPSARHGTSFFAGVAGGTALVAGIVVGRLLSGDESLLLGGRLNAPLGYVNGEGDAFLLGLWSSMLLVEQRRRPALAGLGAGVAAVLASLLVLTQSRGVVLATAVPLVVVLAVVPGRRRRACGLIVIAACVAAAAPTLLDVYGAPRHEPAAATLRHGGVAALVAGAVAAVVWALAVAAMSRLDRRSGGAARPVRLAVTVGLVALVLAGCGAAIAEHSRIGDTISRQYDNFVTLNTAQVQQQPSRLLSGGGNRYDYWRVAVDAWRQHPVLGLGAGNYPEAYYLRRHTDEDVRQPHSLPLQLLSETGIVGALLFLALVVAVAVAAVRRVRRASRPRDAAMPLVAASVGVAVAWLAHASVDWMHLLPGVTGIALGAAAVLTQRGEVVAEVDTRGAGGGLRAPARLAGVAVVAAAVLAGTLALSRQVLADHYRTSAQSQLVRDPLGAIHQANRSLGFDADSIPTYYVKAAAFARLGDGSAAADVLRQAAGREPGNFVTWVLMGDLAVRRGRLHDASRFYGRAHRLNPRDLSILQLARDPARAARTLSYAG